MKKSMRTAMAQKEKIIATCMLLDSPEVLELRSLAGFSLICIDHEHGGWEQVQWAHLIRTAEAAGAMPLIRVSGLVEAEIKTALDVGAAGVMIPGIDSAKAARQAVALSKFPPVGRRGACPFVRANGYGLGDGAAYYGKANEETALILLVEGKEGVEHFDEILQVPGVDAVFFGPFDLSVSLGIPGDVTNPLVENAIRDMLHKANEQGVYAGMLGTSPRAAAKWLRAGADYVLVMQDTLLLLDAATKAVQQVRASLD